MVKQLRTVLQWKCIIFDWWFDIGMREGGWEWVSLNPFNFQWYRYSLHWMAKLMFSSLLVVFFLVFFSVCLSATLQKKKQTMDAQKYFGYVGHDMRTNLEHFKDVTFNSFRYCNFFKYFFRQNPCLFTTLLNNGRRDFIKIFRKYWTWHQK